MVIKLITSLESYLYRYFALKFWILSFKYRIYSINRPGCLLNFWTLRVGAYSRWVLIRGWALIIFFYLQDGRLFEVGANSRLGAYSNKYGTQNPSSSKYCTGWGRDGVVKKVSYRDALPHVQSLTLLCTIFDRKGNLFYEGLPHISHYRE